MNDRSSHLAWALLLTLLPGAGIAAAQTGSTPPPASQFDFLNPGARSLAMGSAFIGLADDATAALTNPAGLSMHLSKPEISIEGRFRHTETGFLEGGRLSGTVTGQGIDTVNGPLYRTHVANQETPSFLSFCYPSKRWAVSVYRHETLKADDTYSSSGPFLLINGVDSAYYPWDETRRVSIVRYGAVGSFKISDKLSVGAGVAATQFSLSSSLVLYEGDPTYAQKRIGPVTFQTTAGSGTKIGVNAGVLFAPIPQIGIGLSYRRAPRFDFNISWADGYTDQGRFRMPDEYGVGVMLNPSEPLKIVVDVARVRYSMLKADYLDWVYESQDAGGPFLFTVDDSTEIHAGAEYVLTGLKFTPALRAGVWYDPFHSLRYTATGDAVTDLVTRLVQPGTKATTHLTGGAGLSLSRNLEVNVGGDFAQKTRIVSVSAVARF